ncbi:hypothetical protein M431DRAFT_234058 [Trichoderma harzianum CBS 226.95]|uniref:Uncharacterized protein n=1 Tax=Trichoderma harzianum CBS 226.95 TaxID=983964 RepID=A0A2T4A283_TRIHA|nr:hypothetical protein M431DRAFT_234058 [Trichoderma harzianum CBS 226.95]PTB51083.1 hypothetical protein M431DRAFT_234058 [Trichoderma harzianum CBS 226.95]
MPVPCSSSHVHLLPPSLASSSSTSTPPGFSLIRFPILATHGLKWSGQRACLLVAYARRQCSSPRGEAPKLRLCNTGLLGKSSAPPCEKPQRKHASRQVRCGNG